MLGDITPQTARITSKAVAYPGHDHVVRLTVTRWDGRKYAVVDVSSLTRAQLVFPNTVPQVVFDSSVDAVFTFAAGGVIEIDLSGYEMPQASLHTWLVVFDAEHLQGQVLVDDQDLVLEIDFRNVQAMGSTPPPVFVPIEEAPLDGETYGRKNGAWVTLDALVSGVISVNGQTGVVALSAADVGAATAAQGALAESAIQPGALTAALSVKEQVLTPGANITIDRTDPESPVISADVGGAVDSVNGKTGVVVLDTDNVDEGTVNLYHTDERAAAAAPVQSVDSQTGVVDLSGVYAPLPHVGAGGGAHANAVAGGAAGFMTGADKTKLDGVAAGATANSSDAVLLDRANHTGEQAISTVAGLQTALDKVKLQSITVACSDETTALTAGNGKVAFRMPYAFTLTAVRASLTTAQTSGSIFTVDINESGATILSTKLTIDNAEKTSTTAATAAVISDSSLADDAEITIDLDQIGDGTAKGLKVTLIGYQS